MSTLIEIGYYVWFAIITALVLSGCGSKDEPVKARPESKFAKVQPLILEHCSPCHDGVKQKAFDTEARWLSSNSKARIENGTMPPNKKLDVKVKESFLASF